MRKVFLLLMALVCCMTAAWAGDGLGTKEKPFTGEWTAAGLAEKLKVGDCLDYNCVIKEGWIYVVDTKLNERIVNNWREWAVGSPISETPFDNYIGYCKWNPLNERKNQMFIITAVEFENDIFTLSGYYSGMYLHTNGEGYLEVHTREEFAAAIKGDRGAKVKLEADIDVRNLGTICDIFTGQIYGKYQYTTESGMLRDTVYSLDGGRDYIDPLFNRLEYAKIEHVMLYNINVSQTGDNIGSLANTATHSQFSYVLMQDVNVSTNNDNAGGMIGKADNCDFEHVSWSNCSAWVNGVGAGGLVGESDHSNYSHCRNNARCYVFSDGRTRSNYAKAGGYVGYSQNDTFTNCFNSAIVGGDEDSVGGFTGRSDNSDFTLCVNSGAIVHASRSRFDEIVSGFRQALDKVLVTYNGLQYVLIFAGMVVGTVGGINSAIAVGAAVGFLLEGSGLLDMAIGLMIGGASLGVFVAAVVAVVVATLLVVDQLSEHDEIGGISGYAHGGQFSLCTNRGPINCKDSQGGGIVGRAAGITVDNCLNSGECKFSDDDCGSIIGQATAGCKVTNCVSAVNYPIIGEASDMNATSGNNYSTKAGANDWEMSVSEEQLKSGIVTHWLNNGYENRKSGAKPWRQNLGEDGDKSPVLDEDHAAVNDDDFIEFQIETPEQLIAFSQHVNEVNQFATACLLTDINMSGAGEWTPIGHDGFTTNFRGFFDGRGHTIRGLKCNSSEAVGLFGTVHVCAEIRNVIIGEDCEFTGTGHSGAGAIVGEVPIGWKWGNVVIENCANYGKVTAQNTVNAGGILGLVRNTTSDNVHVFVNNCYNMGTITTQNGNSALLCGYMRNSGVVSNCWSGGKLLTSNVGVKPFDDTQGRPEYFVGYMDKLDIQNCYSVDAENNVHGATWQTSQAGVLDLYQSHVLEGQLTFRLNGNTNDVSQPLVWQQKLGVDALPEWGSQGVYHTRTVSESSFGENSYGYGTLCLPYDVKSDDNIRYYTFSEATGSNGDVKLNFAYAEVVPAGSPVLFRVQNAGEYSFYGADAGVNGWAYSPNSSQTDTWKLRGTFADTSFGGDDAKSIYYVAGGEIRNATSVSIAPYRAYFTGPSIEDLLGDNTLARVRIVIDGVEDETTSLQLVAGDVVAGQSAKAYTLFGTEVGEGYRGLMIRNGKKVMIQKH